MSDREVMMAIYAAIEKLYNAVTGVPLQISVATEVGTVVTIKSSVPPAKPASPAE